MLARVAEKAGTLVSLAKKELSWVFRQVTANAAGTCR
jgi:hypothetical protein